MYMYNRVSLEGGYSIAQESIGPVKIIIHVHDVIGDVEREKERKKERKKDT